MRMNGLLALLTVVLLLAAFGLAVQEKNQADGLSALQQAEVVVSDLPLSLPLVSIAAAEHPSVDHRTEGAPVPLDDLELALAALPNKTAFTLEVIVVDGVGEPVPGALVEFFMGGSEPAISKRPGQKVTPSGFVILEALPERIKPTTRRALAMGKITLYDVPPGELRSRAVGRLVFSPSLQRPFLVTGDGELQVRLEGHLAVRGRVRLPVPAPVALRLTKLPQAGVDGGRKGELMIASITAHPSSAPFHFGGLEPGNYRLSVAADGHGKRDVQLQLPKDSQALDIELFAQVDVLIDVSYRSGRAPEAFDLQLLPVSPTPEDQVQRGGHPTAKSKANAPAITSRFGVEEVNLPRGRFLFKSLQPGEYVLVVSPRHATRGAKGRQQRSTVRNRYFLTVPPGVSSSPLLQVWLDEPIETALRLTFLPLRNVDVSLRSSLWASLELPSGKGEVFASLLFPRLQSVEQGGEIELELGPTFPGTYELVIEFPDPGSAPKARFIGINAASIPSGGSFRGGRNGFKFRGEPLHPPAQLEPWRAPWKSARLSFTLKRGEARRELTLELQPN